MKLLINGHEYDATRMSTAENITLVHKTTDQMKAAYDDFRAVDQFTLGGDAYTQREFTGMSAFDSGENIQASYNTRDMSGIDPVILDKAHAYDILMGEEA